MPITIFIIYKNNNILTNKKTMIISMFFLRHGKLKIISDKKYLA